jgi:hypothetical protein
MISQIETNFLMLDQNFDPHKALSLGLSIVPVKEDKTGGVNSIV